MESTLEGLRGWGIPGYHQSSFLGRGNQEAGLQYCQVKEGPDVASQEELRQKVEQKAGLWVSRINW